MTGDDFWRYFVYGLVLAMAAMIMTLPKARAEPPNYIPLPAEGQHGIGHAENHAWYQGLHDAEGHSCCNGSDCRPTQHRVVGERVEVLVDGKWTVVPPDKILQKAAPDMQSHVCAPPKEWGHPEGTIFCVIIGAGI